MTTILKKITNWEAWPFKLIYAPLIPLWAWNVIKSGAVWYFTSSNPKLTFGGLDGEPKKEMYDLLPTHLYPITINVLHSQNIEEIKQQIQNKKIKYPLVVKPEIGCAGVLFRKINCEEELMVYHSNIPVDYIVQELVLYPIEVSVFYIRHPQKNSGTITGFLHKLPLSVTGDGTHTVEQLVNLHPKAVKHAAQLRLKHESHWNAVLNAGEKYVLCHAANHNRGAHFIDLKDHIDDGLLKTFDAISLQLNDFFYGRYDILCNSIEELKQGKNFLILEYNGCGAEPNHIYDTGYSLAKAYKEIIKHWQALYQISSYNKSQGIKPWPLLKGIRFRQTTRRHYKILKEADTRMA